MNLPVTSTSHTVNTDRRNTRNICGREVGNWEVNIDPKLSRTPKCSRREEKKATCLWDVLRLILDGWTRNPCRKIPSHTRSGFSYSGFGFSTFKSVGEIGKEPKMNNKKVFLKILL